MRNLAIPSRKGTTIAGCPIFGASFAPKVGIRATREPLSQPNCPKGADSHQEALATMGRGHSMTFNPQSHLSTSRQIRRVSARKAKADSDPQVGKIIPFSAQKNAL
jgi:hypothetical protein